MKTVSTNHELSEMIEQIIKDSGVKKTWMAEKLGVVNQNVNKMIHKKNLSLDDANKILALLGYKALVVIEKE